MYRRRRRRRGTPWWRILLLLALLGAALWFGGRAMFTLEGRYWSAQQIWRGKPSRVKPVVEEALARSARALELPPPAPQLFCEPDSLGRTICGASVSLPPGVSTLEANAEFSARLEKLGLRRLSGQEQGTGTALLRFAAGGKTAIDLTLIPASPTALDTAIAPEPNLPPVPVKIRMALIVERPEDNPRLLEDLAALPGKFTIAVHPEKEGARELADRARRAGMEVVLNLPMEPKGYPTQDPGSNAVLVDMSGRAIRRIVRGGLDRLDPVVGVKTNRGTLAVEDRDVMRAILEELVEPKLVFVDDTREEYSTARDLGREIGITVISVPNRSIVDQGRPDAYAIGVRFDDFVDSCRPNGYGVAILQLKERTIEVLRERIPRLAREGIVVMGLSEVAKLKALE